MTSQRESLQRELDSSGAGYGCWGGGGGGFGTQLSPLTENSASSPGYGGVYGGATAGSGGSGYRDWSEADERIVARAAALAAAGLGPVPPHLQKQMHPFYSLTPAPRYEDTEEMVQATPWRLLVHLSPFTQNRATPWQAYATRPRRFAIEGGGAHGGASAEGRWGLDEGGWGAEEWGAPRTLQEAEDGEDGGGLLSGGLLLPPLVQPQPARGGSRGHGHEAQPLPLL